MDYTIKIGGEAGQGIQTIGGTLARLFARSGYHVFTHQDYESRVRGGHNFYQIRFADSPISASRELIDIIVAFDKDSIIFHEKELSPNGLIIYDSKSLKEQYEGPQFLDIPFADIAVEKGGHRIMANTVAIGSVLGMIGIKTDLLVEIMKEKFRKKGADVIAGNIDKANAGHKFALTNCKVCSFEPAPLMEAKMLITGNDAIGLGAVASGLKFYCAYPMTPSTGIMNYIAGKEEEYGIIVEQAEDEIAAINMTLGASFAGVKSMTGTSGGGFALMTEGLSLAGITETPIVIALAQRPGPATGLPTRTEQGDLQFALYSGHGEFPRAIFAPGTPEQAFYLTNKAFEIAEQFQIPVIIMTDQYLADSEWTLDGLDMTKVIHSDHRLRDNELRNMKQYNRHADNDSGVSPLAIPGESEHLVVTDSDEHDEEGHMIEDSETRINMMNKRLFKKLPLIQEHIAPPELYGADDPEIILVGWGSTYGVIKEIVDELIQNSKIAMIHFIEIYPLPGTYDFNYMNILEKAKITICIENNATGQFAKLIRSETGFEFGTKILKYDGRPFTVESLMKETNEHITGL
jgi:2-oxoglutarate ferredoxin oxidoreductase subunit alpha